MNPDLISYQNKNAFNYNFQLKYNKNVIQFTENLCRTNKHDSQDNNF